jgi:predicted phage baseplate assembly protein
MKGPCCNGGAGAAGPAIPPGLSSFPYRVGTYATFLAAMMQRLSSGPIPALSESDGLKLRAALSGPDGLKTRAPDDASIALCDAWAIVADVLSFYQERIANEGYLRTATERRSVIEMGRLTGYSLRPGVSANVYVAYTMAKGAQATVDVGHRVQSVPPPGDLPQTFETAEAVETTDVWNTLPPRLARPQIIAATTTVAYAEGMSTNLKKNDPVLIVTSATEPPVFDRLSEVIIDGAQKRTLLRLQDTGRLEVRMAAPASATVDTVPTVDTVQSLVNLVAPLSRLPAAHPLNALHLKNSLGAAFSPHADTTPSVLEAITPTMGLDLHRALAHTKVAPDPTGEVHALRVQAAPFGHNAPKKAIFGEKGVIIRHDEWPLEDPEGTPGPDAMTIQLDAVYDQIIPGSWVVIENPKSSIPRLVTRVLDARKTSVARYGLTGRVTELVLQDSWLPKKEMEKAKEREREKEREYELLLSAIRGAVVSAQSEKLALAEEPVVDFVTGDRIELGDLYRGLQPGRWLIVSGERTDIPNTTGVKAAELVMLASVTQDVLSADGTTPLSAASAAAGGTPARARAGEQTHSFVNLAGGLAYSYKRDSVTIHGNVTRATNGESRAEVLGSGDATVANQSFILHMAPLTYVTASTAAGARSTLVVTVNDVPWTEVKSLASAGPTDRVYITSTDDAGVTTIHFGDGVHGARTFSGTANVKAQYRSGIGQAGNVGADQISTLVTRPAGVQAIANPLPAAGGADPESRDEARRNLPVGVMALDRLVSAADYAALARTFAGVAKASAAQLRQNGKPLIGITIAGAADAPVPPGSDLIVNLTAALRQAGGARQQFVIAQRQLILLVAGVSLTPAAGTSWETLAVQVRSAVLAAFAFDRRALAQSAALSELLGVIHRVPGVAAATVTQFDGISGDDADTIAKLQEKLHQIASAASPNQVVAALPGRLDPMGIFLPAQLAILSPDIADTLILSQASP